MVKNLVRFSLEWTSLISRKEKMMRSNRIYLTFQARTLGGEAGGHRVQVSGRGDISKWECSGTGRIWAYLQCPPRPFPGGSAGEESTCNEGDLGSVSRLGRSLGEGKSYPLQYSGLENSMDCIVHWVTKSPT